MLFACWKTRLERVAGGKHSGMSIRAERRDCARMKGSQAVGGTAIKVMSG